MFSYFKWIIYHFLSIADAIFNFLLALLGSSSNLSLSTNFLVFVELRRVDNVIEKRISERERKKGIAEKGMANARNIVDGKNI
jgi:hypothetical protein